MTDKPSLTTPLLSFDFNATLAGKANELAKKTPSEPTPSEPIPTPPPPSRRRMATKKTAAAPAPPPPAAPPLWHKVVRNWKTDDEQLDYELRFDAEGDPQVTVFDADHDEGKTEPVLLSVSMDRLEEAIEILQAIHANAKRIRTGELTAEDTIEESARARRPDDEDDDEGDET